MNPAWQPLAALTVQPSRQSTNIDCFLSARQNTEVIRTGCAALALFRNTHAEFCPSGILDGCSCHGWENYYACKLARCKRGSVCTNMAVQFEELDLFAQLSQGNQGIKATQDI